MKSEFEMLSHSDIHYLISVLLLTVQAPDVEIKLGDRIYDQAANVKRDVDITLALLHADGTRSIIAVEIKDEAGPLDLIDIDYLINKLRDMPSVLHKMIIASHGFSKPAIQKARYHNIALVHFSPWLDYYEDNIFGVKFAKELETNNIIYTTGLISPIFLFRVGSDTSESETIEPTSQVVTNNSSQKTDFRQFLDTMALKIGSAVPDEQKNRLNEGEFVDISVKANLTDKPSVQLNGKTIEWDRLRATVRCLRSDSKTKPTYWCLRADGQKYPYVACALFDAGIGNSDLAGLVYRPGYPPNPVRIPATARSRRAVRDFQAQFRTNGIGDLRDTSK